VTFSGNFVTSNSPSDYDLKAATGGAANFSGTLVLTGSNSYTGATTVSRAASPPSRGRCFADGRSCRPELSGVRALFGWYDHWGHCL